MVINTTDIQLYELLRQKLGEREAETLVNFVDSKLKDNNEINLRTMATKEYIASTKEYIAQVESRLTMRMFYFWIGQVAVIGGLLAYFFKTH